MTFHVPNQYRRAPVARGNNGAFLLPPHGRLKALLFCIASDDADWEDSGLPLPAWEHVSVSTRFRAPYWAEMCMVKELFWDAEDTVMQLHPPKSEWRNLHEFCLHLWRPIGIEIPRQPNLTVAP